MPQALPRAHDFRKGGGCTILGISSSDDEDTSMSLRNVSTLL
jgi:hypothetical protein